MNSPPPYTTALNMVNDVVQSGKRVLLPLQFTKHCKWQRRFCLRSSSSTADENMNEFSAFKEPYWLRYLLTC